MDILYHKIDLKSTVQSILTTTLLNRLQIYQAILLKGCPYLTTLVSGSPIIQDGKLVGAVTHVLVADPTEGYGIFTKNMLSAAQTIPKAS